MGAGSAGRPPAIDTEEPAQCSATSDDVTSVEKSSLLKCPEKTIFCERHRHVPVERRDTPSAAAAGSVPPPIAAFFLFTRKGVGGYAVNAEPLPNDTYPPSDRNPAKQETRKK